MKYLFFMLVMLVYSNDMTAKSIKAISYNIRLATSSDGENQWNNRKRDLAEFLIHQQADFIGIQEALWNQVEYLDSMLQDYAYIGVGRDDGQEQGEAMLIFYLHNQWTLKESNTDWLSETPHEVSRGWDAACNRTVTKGLFADEMGNTIYIWNTHFDHAGNIAREKSTELISDEASRIHNKNRMILLGDFNLTPDTDLYKKLTSSLKDAAVESEVQEVEYQGTYNGFQMEAEHKRRIDYIFFNGKGLKIKSYRVPVPKTSQNLHLSDHFPVITEFEIS